MAMARKSNIRSIRFTDELAELIDRQVGETFTQKFENLIIRCVYELPEKERKIELLETEIKDKKQQLRKLSEKTAEYAALLCTLERQLLMISATIKELENP